MVLMLWVSGSLGIRALCCCTSLACKGLSLGSDIEKQQNQLGRRSGPSGHGDVRYIFSLKLQCSLYAVPFRSVSSVT